MQYMRLGRSGLKVSRIGLGMMSYGDPLLPALGTGPGLTLTVDETARLEAPYRPHLDGEYT